MTNGDATYKVISDKHYETMVSTVRKMTSMPGVSDKQRQGLDKLLADLQQKPVKTRHDIIAIANAVDQLGLPESCAFETGLFHSLGFEAAGISTGAYAQKEADDAYLRGRLVDWNTKRIVKEIEASDLTDGKKETCVQYFTQLNPNGPITAEQAKEISDKANNLYKERKKNGLPDSLRNEVVFFKYVAEKPEPADVIRSIVGAPAEAQQKLDIFLDAFERMKHGETFDPKILPRELRDDFGPYLRDLSVHIADEAKSREKIKRLEDKNKELRKLVPKDTERDAKKYTDLAEYLLEVKEALFVEGKRELKEGPLSVPLYEHNRADYEETPEAFPGNPALKDKRTLSVIVTELVTTLELTAKELKIKSDENTQLSAQHDETKQKLTIAEQEAREANARHGELQTKYTADISAKDEELRALRAKYDSDIAAKESMLAAAEQKAQVNADLASGIEGRMKDARTERSKALAKVAGLETTISLQADELKQYRPGEQSA